MVARQKSAAKKDAEKAPSGPVQVHMVFGEDEYMVSSTARQLVDELCPPADQAFGLETVDGGSGTVDEAIRAVNQCLDALQTVGFMGGRKVVWFKGVSFLSETIVGRSKDVKGALDKLTALLKSGLGPDQVLLISATKVDKRSAFYKTCQSVGRLQEFAMPERSYQAEKPAREKVAELLKASGFSFNDAVVHAFVERAGFDTRQIVMEVEKLRLYLGSRKDVKLEDIDAIVSRTRESEAWDFADAVAEGDLKKSLNILRQLLFQGESAVGLIISLERRFKELLILRECIDKRWLKLSGDDRWTKAFWSDEPGVDAKLSALAKDPRSTNPFRIGILAGQARKYSVDKLFRFQEWTLQTHEQLVSSRVPPNLLLEFLVIKLLGVGQTKSAARFPA
jgi:DNA polymerase-3 subunit delta